MKKKFLAMALITVLALTAAGCGSDKLTYKTFDDVCDQHHLRCEPLDVDVNGVKDWYRVFSDDENDELRVDFIECTSASSASSIYQEQVTNIASFETDTEKGSSANGSYQLSASGYYYQVRHIGNYVILATCESQHKSEAQEFMNDLPQE